MSASAARLGAAVGPAARAGEQPQRRVPPDHGAPLRIVGRATRRAGRARSLARALAASMVTGALFVVVIGHAELAQGQVRLARVEAAITAAQTLQRKEVLSLAQLEAPARILKEATRTLHMSPATGIRQLPYVALSTPLPAPQVAPATSVTGTGQVSGG